MTDHRDARAPGHPPTSHFAKRTGPREIAWFIGLWAAGVVAVALVSGVLKMFLG